MLHRFHRRRGFVVAASLAVVVLLSSATSAHVQLEGSAPFSEAGTSATKIDAFLARLRHALDRNDRDAVCRMVTYPARIWDGHQTVKVRSARDLRRRFTSVFTADVLKIINQASSSTAWANSRGVMFESGRIWLGVDGEGHLHIESINPPLSR